MTSRFLPATLALAALLASCGGEGAAPDDAGAPPPAEGEARSRQAVTMTVELRGKCVEPEALPLVVENHGNRPVTYGVGFRLERLEGGEWAPVKLNRFFSTVALRLEPGNRRRETLQLPGRLEAGQYRVVRDFAPVPRGRSFVARAELRICRT